MIMIQEERSMYTTKPGKSLLFNGKGFSPERVNGMTEELGFSELSDQLTYGVIRRHFRDGEEDEEQRRIIIGI